MILVAVGSFAVGYSMAAWFSWREGRPGLMIALVAVWLKSRLGQWPYVTGYVDGYGDAMRAAERVIGQIRGHARKSTGAVPGSAAWYLKQSPQCQRATGRTEGTPAPSWLRWCHFRRS